MKQKYIGSILEHFSILPDPRRENHNTKKHKLIDIIVITVLAVICGAEDWPTIVAFGKKKEKRLKKILELPNGIPSHDTFGRVFSILDPVSFQECYFDWVKTINLKAKGKVVALDGKTNRRARGQKISPLHIVSAFATADGVVLGQQACDKKSNEITAVPALLKLLKLNGCIVTADAMSCQKEIVKTILKQGAGYLLAVKDNQRRLHEDLKTLFKYGHDRDGQNIKSDSCESSDKDHGRTEVRRCFTIADRRLLQTIGTGKEDWPGLQSIAQVICRRTVKGRTAETGRDYISSLSGTARKILKAAREHWQVENNLHWSLDVSFREDESRIRIGHAQENLSIVRKLALSLLKNKPTGEGVKSRRLQAGWDEDYLLAVAGVRV